MKKSTTYYLGSSHLSIPSSSSGCQKIAVTDIVRAQALSNYSKVFFSNGKYVVVSKVLRWFIDKLPPEDFSRVHKSHLVNSGFIAMPTPLAGNMLQLSNGELIPVSRRRKTGFVKSIRAA